MLALIESPARDFLRGLGEQLGKPSAILVASAHWETRVPAFNSIARNTTIHNFYGFPPALFAMRYEPPGAPALAETAAGCLSEAGLPVAIDPNRELDHGAWVPLTPWGLGATDSDVSAGRYPNAAGRHPVPARSRAPFATWASLGAIA